VEVKEQWQVKTEIRFVAFRNLWWWWWCGHQKGLGKYQREYKTFSHRESRLLQIETA